MVIVLALTHKARSPPHTGEARNPDLRQGCAPLRTKWAFALVTSSFVDRRQANNYHGGMSNFIVSHEEKGGVVVIRTEGYLDDNGGNLLSEKCNALIDSGRT